MIFGVTGGYGSGKDEVANILETMSFRHHSLSDFLREELRRREVDITRDNLIDLGNELRRVQGPSVLAQMAAENVQDGENYVFSSVRNEGEVLYLKERDDFALVEVVTPPEVRIERINARGKAGDPTTLEDMLAKERQESSSDPSKQQLEKVFSHRNIVIVNDDTFDVLAERVGEMVGDWMYKLQDQVPSWDEYFMNIAEAVKLRASCMSAKKGAIAVRDKQILSTGYNGTAKGVTNCAGGGCPRCTARHKGEIKSGKYSAPCTCAHAEGNVIAQAASNGTSTNGATMYATHEPCTDCAKYIINSGFVRVLYKYSYPDSVGKKLFEEAGVELVHLDTTSPKEPKDLGEVKVYGTLPK